MRFLRALGRAALFVLEPLVAGAIGGALFVASLVLVACAGLGLFYLMGAR